MKENHGHELQGTSNLSKYGPEGCSVRSIKSFCQIDECHVQVLVLFSTLLLDLPCSKDHIHCASTQVYTSQVTAL